MHVLRDLKWVMTLYRSPVGRKCSRCAGLVKL